MQVWLWLPAPTWSLTAICNSSSKALNTLWPPQAPGVKVVHKHACRQTTCTRFKKKICEKRNRCTKKILYEVPTGAWGHGSHLPHK